MADGGAVALSGFRYQILRALEELLELHRKDPGGDWAVEVEHATNDKVDYAVYESGSLTRAVQVKASLPGSSTRLTLRGTNGVAKILRDLWDAFPSAPEVVLISNRKGPWDAIAKWIVGTPSVGGPALRAVRELRTLNDVERAVSELLREARQMSGLPSDPPTIGALASIIEARLWKLGAQELASTATGRRWLRGCDVQEILGLRDQALAAAVGEASWAAKWKEPAGRAITRPGAMSFLAYELSRADLASRVVRRAALTGFGGLGKSMAAARWAAEQQSTYAMVLWFIASTPETIEAGVREMLSTQYGDEAAEWPVPVLQDRFREWLTTTPRSWLLVLDDAESPETIDGWMPTSGFGHVLLTTRDAAWPASHTPSFEIGRLDDGEIRSMVALQLGEDDLSSEDLHLLVRTTDRWALAVDMVLAWLTRHQHSLADLTQFDPQASRQLLLEQPDLVPAGYTEPVVAVILDALAGLQREHPEAWGLLQSTVALGGQEVPVAMASDHSGETLEDLVDRDKLVAELRSRSLASPFSVGDPRLLQWGHRLNVHSLIAQQVQHLDPVAEGRWGVLLERLALVVGDAAEEHKFVLALSLEVVVDAVDRAVRTGAPFSVGYLTLLGNMAAVLVAAGRAEEASRRLRAEAYLAETQAAQFPPTLGRPIEWFGLLAKLQLATVEMLQAESGEALSLLEEVVPELEKFRGSVNSDKLSNVLESAVDVLESIRMPDLLARRDALRAVVASGAITESSSPVRRAEALLREDNLAGARGVCQKALSCGPRLMDEICLYGKLAESWAVDDIPRSDELHRLALVKAQEEGIDLLQPLDDLQDTIQRRIRHLLSLDPVVLHRDLSQYRSWFIADVMSPSEGELRTWRRVTMARFSRAWRDLTDPASSSTRAVSILVESFCDPTQEISPDELLGKRSLLWGTQFVDAGSSLEYLQPIVEIARKGSMILIEASPRMWANLPALAAAATPARSPLVVGHRYGPLVLVQIGTWGMFMEAIDFDPFTSVRGATTICLVRPGGLGSASRMVDGNDVIELGTIESLRADEEY